jgi:VCBS repeat-containing protein
VYTPVANFNGADSFNYTVSDGHGGTSTATASFNIGAINDAPVAVTDSYTTNEDTAIDIINAPGTSILANDSDVDSASLSAILVSGPTHGTLTLQSNGKFTYTPTANYNGTDSFSYKANAGSLDSNVATANLTVTLECCLHACGRRWDCEWGRRHRYR